MILCSNIDLEILPTVLVKIQLFNLFKTLMSYSSAANTSVPSSLQYRKMVQMQRGWGGKEKKEEKILVLYIMQTI